MSAAQVPGRPMSPRYRNVLPHDTMRDRITRYLAHMTPGGILTSNFLAQCEVASSEQIRSVKCRACKGLGARDDDPWAVERWGKELGFLDARLEDLTANGGRKNEIDDCRRKADKLRRKITEFRQCTKCNGTGYRERHASRELADKVWNTVRCGKCHGTGEIANEDAEDECPRCRGDGCVVPQTVRSTGSSKKGKLPPGATSFTGGTDGAWMPPEPVEEEQATEYAETGRVLRSVAEEAPNMCDAVSEYHGPEGDKWAPHSWGRAFALWSLTAGGRGLAELYLRRPELKGAGHLVRPIDRIVAEREAESRTHTPDMLRRTLISRADSEARVLEARMLQAINDAEARVG